MEKIEKFIIDHKKIEIQSRSFRQNKKGLKQNDMNQDFMDFLQVLKLKLKFYEKVEKVEK